MLLVTFSKDTKRY